MSAQTFARLLMLFGSLSILSIGGGNSTLPEMHLRAVSQYHWLTNGQFADLFAISEAAPGPSVLIVTLVGYKAAGLLGAIVATVAMIIPAAVLVYLTTVFWEKAKEAQWRKAVEKGFAPLTVGLILASGVIISRSADHGFRQYALTAAATLVLTCTKISPLIVVGVAGLIGWLGFA